MDWLSLYFLNEQVGSTPATIADAGPAAQVLNVNYGTSEADWVAGGLRISAGTNSSAAGLRGALNAAMVAALSNAQQFVLIFTQTGIAGDDAASMLWELSDGTTTPLMLRLSSIGLLQLTINGEDSAGFYGGDATVIRVDTTAATAAERVKVTAVEYGAPAVRDMSGNAIAQNASLGDVAGMTASFLNNFAQNQNVSIDACGFLGWGEGTLTDQETLDILTALVADDDSDPYTPATLEILSGPTASNINDTVFDLALTTNFDSVVDILVAADGTPQPSDTAFDGATFGGNSTGETAFTDSITGLTAGTTYTVWVRVYDGADTLYISLQVTTAAAFVLSIQSVNGGDPIKNGSAYTVLVNGGAQSVSAITLNGVAQAFGAPDDTTLNVTFTWPLAMYDEVIVLDVDGVTANTSVVPAGTNGYAEADGTYNAAEEGTILVESTTVAQGDQLEFQVPSSNGVTFTVAGDWRPDFNASDPGYITARVLDSADFTFGEWRQYSFTASVDDIPDSLVIQPAVGAPLNTQVESAPFTPTGYDQDQDISVSAEAGLEYAISLDGGSTFGAYTAADTTFQHVTGQPAPQLKARLTSSAVNSDTVSLSLTIGGQVAAFSVTTVAADAPEISVQPADTTAEQGAQFTLSVTASGSGSLTYQWQRNAANIAGATANVYTGTAGTDGVDGDQFTVTVTDGEGDSTVSSAATLSVSQVQADVTPPTITLQGGNPLEVEVGSPYVEPGFVAYDSNDGYITGDVVISGVIDMDTIGSYTLTYSVADAAGNVRTVQRAVDVVSQLEPALVAGKVLFVVDYRQASNPLVYAIIGDKVVDQATINTSNPLYFFARSDWQSDRQWFVRANVGQDLTNSRYGSDLNKAMASVGVNPRQITGGWGGSRQAPFLDALPVISLVHPGPVSPGTLFDISAQCIDSDGNDQSEHLQWFNMAESWNNNAAFAIGAVYSYTPESIGYYPIRVEYHDVHGREISKRVGVMVDGEVLEFGVQQFDETLTHNLVSELVLNSVRFGSLVPAGAVALVNQALWGDFQYFELTLMQADNAGRFGFGVSTGLGDITNSVIGGRSEVDVVSDGPGWLAIETQLASSDTVSVIVNGAVKPIQKQGISFSVDADDPATCTLGFAVDFRDKTSQPIVHVIGWDQVSASPVLLGSAEISNAHSPVHPMVYCLEPGNTQQGELDVTFNGGSQPFVYSPGVVLGTEGIDTVALKSGWGVDAI